MKHSILFLLLLPLFSLSQTGWVTVQVDNRVSVNFPSQPQIKESAGWEVWSSEAEGFKCNFILRDLATMGIDSATLSTEFSKEAFLNDFGNSMVAKWDRSTLLSRERGIVSGRSVLNYKVDLKMDDSPYDRTYCLVFIVGTKIYAANFSELSSNEKEAARANFLNSFKVN